MLPPREGDFPPKGAALQQRLPAGPGSAYEHKLKLDAVVKAQRQMVEEKEFRRLQEMKWAEEYDEQQRRLNLQPEELRELLR